MSLLPEHPGADNWPNIRAAGASGSAPASLPQFGISALPGIRWEGSPPGPPGFMHEGLWR